MCALLKEILKEIFGPDITLVVESARYGDMDNVLTYLVPRYEKEIAVSPGKAPEIRGDQDNIKIITNASVKNTNVKVEPFYAVSAIDNLEYLFVSPKDNLSSGAQDFGCALGAMAKPLIVSPNRRVIFYGGTAAVGTNDWYIEYYEVKL